MTSHPEHSTTVLIVDDEEPMRSALQRFLKGLDLPTFTAASGAEALEVLRAHAVALMLADIRMPGMSGIDLVPQALALDPDLAVVMLSAVNDATTAALCMQRGAMDYLTKPLDLDDLARAVQGALRRREERRATREIDQRAKEALERERAKAARLTVDVDSLAEGADLYQAGMTSHASVNVMLALEGEFDVEFPDHMLKRSVFESIAAITTAIDELTAGR